MTCEKDVYKSVDGCWVPSCRIRSSRRRFDVEVERGDFALRMCGKKVVRSEGHVEYGLYLPRRNTEDSR